jgi:hypothetical protein
VDQLAERLSQTASEERVRSLSSCAARSPLQAMAAVMTLERGEDG